MKRTSINGQLKNLILTLILPMSTIIIVIFVMFTGYNIRYANASGNIARASGFSQSFKDDIDLKMYYFATDSEYATGIPYEEVETALNLAKSLRKSTYNKDSQKAIDSVLNLCDTLRDRIEQIRVTEAYDERIAQLEANVYILTELIQNYMYTYLFYEAGELAMIQESMKRSLEIAVVVAFCATAVLVIVTINKSIHISRDIRQPIDNLYQRVLDIGEGALIPQEPVQAADRKIQALSDGFEEMVGRLSQLLELNKAEAARIRSMELMLLQAQINPHFLYNTLDTIIWLIETGKPDQAVEMVSSLSNFFRSSLSKGRDVITLEEEALHVRSYLEIQQVRYKDILEYSVSIDKEICDYRVPKLTLQPVVENALYHGIKLKRAKGRIDITGERTATGICIRVVDTGVGMNAETLEKVRESLTAEHSDGFGMAAVYKRLMLMFADNCTFTIESTEGVGTTVTINITDREMNEDDYDI